MSQKDFLSQFSGDNNKPDSFKEEVRVPVKKTRKPVNKWLIIILAAALIVGAILSYVLFFMPKITVPYFVGSSKTDVAQWVKQQGIEPSGIIFKEKYDFDTNKDTILSQDVESGKKVTDKAKITFELSLGPDPNEKIALPDLMNMTKSEIQDWANANKMSSVRFTSTYSDKIEEGSVIKTNKINEDDFKRSTSLEITISKGPQPAGVVKMEDFKGKQYIEMEAWAKNNKIELSKSEQYSDKEQPGVVIAQSVEKDKEIKQGDTVAVVVSKGKAVVMTNIGEWLESDILYWCGSNGVGSKKLDSYYDKEGAGECIYQYPAPGTVLSSNDRIEYRLSLGNFISFNARTYDELVNQMCEANLYRANLTISAASYEYHDTIPAGELISYSTSAKIGDTLFAVVSKGRNNFLNPTVVDSTTYNWQDIASSHYSETVVRQMLIENNISNYKFNYVSSDVTEIGNVVGVSPAVSNGTYLGDDVQLVITVRGE